MISTSNASNPISLVFEPVASVLFWTGYVVHTPSARHSSHPLPPKVLIEELNHVVPVTSTPYQLQSDSHKVKVPSWLLALLKDRIKMLTTANIHPLVLTSSKEVAS